MKKLLWFVVILSLCAFCLFGCDRGSGDGNTPGGTDEVTGGDGNNDNNEKPDDGANSNDGENPDDGETPGGGENPDIGEGNEPIDPDDGEEENSSIDVTFGAIEIDVWREYALPSKVTVAGSSKNLNYSVDGDGIEISGGKMKATSDSASAIITATAKDFKMQFAVAVDGADAPSVESASSTSADVSFTFALINLAVGSSYKLPEAIIIGGEAKALEYSFEGENISIEDYTLVPNAAGKQTQITVSADGFSMKFSVKGVAVGELVIADMQVMVGDSIAIAPNFTSAAGESDIIYKFEGENISIEDGVIHGLVADTYTTVSATSGYHKTNFTVYVYSSDIGEMKITAPSVIYSNYAPKTIGVEFTNAFFASDVTYKTNHPSVFVEDGKIWATGTFSGTVTVTVTVEGTYHTSSFTVEVSNFNKNSAETKVAYYESNLIKEENKGGIIFVGDSYFDGYPSSSTGLPPFWSDFYTDYAGEKAFLMGISSSQIDTWEIVSERVVYPMEPSEIVMHIGFNDAHHSSYTAEQLTSRIIAVIEEYHEKLPNAKIYYCSVEPKKDALSATTNYYESSMIKAPAMNAIMKSFAEQNSDWMTFINTSALCFNSDGSINQTFYIGDLSHPTLASYDKYRRLIEIARGNASPDDPIEKTEEEIIADSITAASSAVAAEAAQAKTSGEVYTINNVANANGQTVAKYFTDASGNALTQNYSISGYMDISNATLSGAHIQFRFNATADRFLLYDSTGDGKLGICAPFAGISGESSTGAIPGVFDAYNGSVTLKWQVIVSNNVAYLYINDVLTLSGTPSGFPSFNVSVQKADIAIYGVEIITKAENATAYNAIIAKLPTEK